MVPTFKTCFLPPSSYDSSSVPMSEGVIKSYQKFWACSPNVELPEPSLDSLRGSRWKVEWRNLYIFCSKMEVKMCDTIY